MLDRVFTPVSIGSLEVANRVVMPPMVTRFADEKGYVTDQSIAYYRERAAGGTGLLILEGTYPSERHPKRHLLVDDSYIPGLRRLVDTVHDEGSKMAVQLNVHRGIADRVNPVSPSTMTTPDGTHVPSVSVDELEAMTEAFAAGAGRAKDAGFDGIEIHACSGYLVHLFLSQRTNQRTDAYGGSLDARTKFARDLLAGVRDVVGSEFPVWFRIPGDEFLDGGLTSTDAARIAERLERAGSDAFHVTAGHFLNAGHVMLTGRDERGTYVKYADAVNSAVEVPVITVGRINDPVTAEEILAAGKADLVAMGRAHIADPHFVRKAKAGELDRIRHCVGGLEGCRDLANGAVSCTVNPVVGTEATASCEESRGPSRAVFVVGGGPAGMEAARVSAERGHDVTLVEKEPELGGQLRYAQHAPAKREYETLVSFYERELEILGVDVRLTEELDPDDLETVSADEVIVAVGAVPDVPNIDGIGAGVRSGAVVPAKSVFNASDSVVSGMSVVLGGSDTAFDVADFRSTHGCETMVVSPGDVLPLRGGVGEISTRPHILDRYRTDPLIEVLEHYRIGQIREKSVVIRGKGSERTVSCAQVVLAEVTPEVTFTQGIAGDAVHVVGDADGVRGLHTAIHEANEVAAMIPRAEK